VQLIRSELRAGAAFAAHSHVNEQVTLVLEGCLEITMNGTAHRVESGMILRIPSNVPHAARVCSDTPAVIVEAFSPPRDDLRNLSVE
jgi:quercetin dioxygenase-like cupin family protein